MKNQTLINHRGHRKKERRIQRKRQVKNVPSPLWGEGWGEGEIPTSDIQLTGLSLEIILIVGF